MSLTRLGWGPFFEQQRRDDPLSYARVVEVQRGACRIAGEVDGWAEVSGRFRNDAATAADFPTVGDWVGVRDYIIHCRLDRRSTISRTSAGRAGDRQVIAANVDTIFAVTAVVDDLSVRRIERYLTMIWDAGAVPVVVLNKSDLSSDPESAAAGVRARLPFVDVIVVSAMTREGLDQLEPYLVPAQTIALVGSSGVGKSTIVNRLLGRDVQRVGAVRESDGRGKHVTTARQLMALSAGALLVDTPGMRELQPWADDTAVEGAFDDIASLSASCRFADCRHDTEPGCAILAAVESGRLDPDRLENYRRILREAAFETRKHDKFAAAEHKRHWKKIHQANKKMYRDRGR